MKYLIVNADDYGHTAGVARGIREAHTSGIVTSTTAMMNRPGVEKELREAARSCPNLGLGVHLVLTTGTPVLAPGHIPSLVDNNGRFFRQHALEARLESIRPEEARAEWRAQIEKFCATLGHPPDHLDSHHHTSYWTPQLFEEMLKLAAEYNCPIRRWVSTDATAREPDPAESKLLQSAADAAAAHHVATAEYLCAAFYEETATLDNLLAILAALPDRVTELMTHPAQVDDELCEVSSYNRQRARELAIITDPAAKEAVGAYGIKLDNFGSLKSRLGPMRDAPLGVTSAEPV